MNTPKKRIRKPVESPKTPFDAAKIIHKAIGSLCADDKLRAVRWALEASHYYRDITLKIGNQP